jgi:hypothetical protein
MKVVKYISEENDNLYDVNSIKSILGINKSKLQREFKKLPEKQFIKYKNQYLFKEKTLFDLMINRIFERLYKMEIIENELQKN